jgi:regulator of sirC expression with transglutaminase-like and TPR domain
MTEKEIQALISLLDDPDDNVYTHIKGKILDMGDHVIPNLEHAWENSFNPFFQQRIENLIHEIQFQNVKNALREWSKTNEKDLLTGALIVSRYQYPDLDETKINEVIQKVTQDIWLELNDNLTALEKIKVINHIFFDVHGFSGNKTNYHAPQNCYINNLIETKKGNPLTLSMLYMIICQSLGVPVYGVNLPQHFVMCYISQSRIHDLKAVKREDILFYINTFSLGYVFSDKDIDKFLKQLNLDLLPEHYLPADNLTIINRCINNLILSYEKLGYPDKVEELESLKQCLFD